MKDKRDPRSIGDVNNDGITGHSMGTNSRANWITENLGKTIIIIIVVIIGIAITASLSMRVSDDSNNEPNSSESPFE